MATWRLPLVPFTVDGLFATPIHSLSKVMGTTTSESNNTVNVPKVR